LQLINDIPKKLHAKKEKLMKRFSEIGTFQEKLTLTDDRQVAQQS
jgi:hypothetical protein